MGSHHMGSSYASGLIFNSSGTSISSTLNNISYLPSNAFVPSTNHYFSSYTTSPTLPPLTLPPPQPSTGPSSCYPPTPFPMRGGNIHRNEFFGQHHHSRGIMGRQSTASTTSPVAAYNNMFPTNIPWPAFETPFDMRPFQTLTRPAKQKRPRMSLQKRLLVNARERERMRVLNEAFESLRDALPCYVADGHMAKITTLRLAINYIKALTDLLNEQNNISSSNNNRLTKTGFPYSSEHQENFITTIFRDSTTDSIRPAFKNLDERLAIGKKLKWESEQQF